MQIKENVRYYLTNLKQASLNKNNTIAEYRKECEKAPFESWIYRDALVTKEVIMNHKEYEEYSKNLLDNKDFLIGTGGTATDSPLFDDESKSFNQIWQTLTQEQKDSVKFYDNNCVAIFENETLMFIIDTEGSQYARYVLLESDKTQKLNNVPPYEPHKKLELKKKNADSYCLFGKNGTMQRNKALCEPLPTGTVIIDEGVGSSLNHYYVATKDWWMVPLTYTIPSVNARHYATPRKYETTIKHINEKFGIGYYYTDNIVDMNVVEKCRQVAAQTLKIQEEHKTIIDKQKEETRNKILEEYNYLEKLENIYDKKAVNKNIKTLLLKHFPKTKFNISTKNHSISWTNGPTKEEVEKIVYIFENTVHYTDDYVYDYYREKDKPEVCKADIFQSFFGYMEYIFYYRTETPEGEKPEQKNIESKIETKNTMVQIIDYSDKVIAIVGDTKPIKEKLKEIGAKFNPRLTCGCGWIISKQRQTEIQKLLKII